MTEENIKQYLKTHLPEDERWTGFKAVLFDMDGVLYDLSLIHI